MNHPLPYQPGDRVQIVRGKHLGKTGTVIGTEGERVQVRSHLHPDSVKLFSPSFLSPFFEPLKIPQAPMEKALSELNGHSPMVEPLKIPQAPMEKALSELKSWAIVALYESHGSAYFRLMWGRGHRILGQRHIPGGNAASELARDRKAQVEQMIHNGAPVEQISHEIASFPSAKRGRKPRRK
jgi:hypothetical protein